MRADIEGASDLKQDLVARLGARVGVVAKCLRGHPETGRELALRDALLLELGSEQLCKDRELWFCCIISHLETLAVEGEPYCSRPKYEGGKKINQSIYNFLAKINLLVYLLRSAWFYNDGGCCDERFYYSVRYAAKAGVGAADTALRADGLAGALPAGL